jgi:hypothetical protein
VMTHCANSAPWKLLKCQIYLLVQSFLINIYSSSFLQHHLVSLDNILTQ